MTSDELLVVVVFIAAKKQKKKSGESVSRGAQRWMDR